MPEAYASQLGSSPISTRANIPRLWISYINSLAPGGHSCNFRLEILILKSRTDILSIFSSSDQFGYHQCWPREIHVMSSYRCLSGKLWYLQHNCVGDTIVYHWASNMVSHGHNELTLTVWGTEWSAWLTSIICQLMPRWHSAPCHQQAWKWLRKMEDILPFLMMNFNNVCNHFFKNDIYIKY